MKDLPRTTGNVFFIYANVAAGGSPTVRVSPSVSSITGIASMTGGLDNENLEITPNGSGGFDVELKVNQSQGFYSFLTSVTTNGDSTHEAATVSFTFYVVLVGADEVFDVIKREYRVGEEVDEELELYPANGVHDYRVTGGSLRAMDVDSEGAQYASGLTVSVRAVGSTDEVWLTGWAKRPGCYLAWLDCTTWDSGSGASHFGGGGNLAAPVIISIRDRDVELGVLCLMVPQTVSHNDKALRLVMCDDDVFPNMGGWFKVRLSESSGVWAGQYAKQVYNGTEYHDYRVELTGQTWALKTRVYNEGDTPPAWSTVATAPAITGTEWTATIPPSSGWSDRAVLTGDTWYTVPGQGMFDYKGEYQGRPVYQEQCIHTQQYAGWDRASEYQNNAGRLLWQDGNGKWSIYSTAWVELVPHVSPFGIDGAAIPYAPPVMEKIGSDPVRDLSFAFDAGGVSTALNVNHAVSAGALALFSGNLAGGIFGWFDAARLIVPYNGSSGDRKFSSGISCTIRQFTLKAANVHRMNTDKSGSFPIHDEQTRTSDYESGGEIRWRFSGDIPFGTRSEAIPVLFGDVATGAEIETEHYVDGGDTEVYRLDWGIEPWDEETIVTTYTKGTETFTPSGQLPILLLYPFSAPDAKSGKWHQRWFAARLTGGGGALNWTDTKTRTYTYNDPDIPEDTVTENVSGNITMPGRYQTARPVRFDGFEIDGQTTYTEVGTFTAVAYTYDSDWGQESAPVTVVKWYELTITKNIVYTKVGSTKIGDSVSFSWTRKTRPAGTYPSFPAYVVETGSSTDFAEYEALVAEALEKVADYVAPSEAPDNVGQAVYSWTDDSNVIKIEWGAE